MRKTGWCSGKTVCSPISRPTSPPPEQVLARFPQGHQCLGPIITATFRGSRGALTALNMDPEKLDIALVQFANLIRDGKQVSMSTRSGEFVTLRELRAEVGNDAARLFYVLRKVGTASGFRSDLAKSQSNDNPVYYIQYAHARICRVQEEWGGVPIWLAQSRPARQRARDGHSSPAVGFQRNHRKRRARICAASGGVLSPIWRPNSTATTTPSVSG